MKTTLIKIYAGKQNDKDVCNNAEIQIYIPHSKKNEAIDTIAKALAEDDDVIFDDIRGHTYIIPNVNLFYAREIVFIDMEETNSEVTS